MQSFNLSCIVTSPKYLRKGFGYFLIDFSYLISLTEGRIGAPEKPFSALGAITYMGYWRTKILEYLYKSSETDSETSLKNISMATAIDQEDILHTLESLGIMNAEDGSENFTVNINRELINKKNKITAKKENFIMKKCTLHQELANLKK